MKFENFQDFLDWSIRQSVLEPVEEKQTSIGGQCFWCKTESSDLHYGEDYHTLGGFREYPIECVNEYECAQRIKKEKSGFYGSYTSTVVKSLCSQFG